LDDQTTAQLTPAMPLTGYDVLDIKAATLPGFK
jgi:hypothetical protein